MSDGDSMRRREENSVRVTNLSEDTREDDLRVSQINPANSELPLSTCVLGSILTRWPETFLFIVSPLMLFGKPAHRCFITV